MLAKPGPNMQLLTFEFMSPQGLWNRTLRCEMLSGTQGPMRRICGDIKRYTRVAHRPAVPVCKITVVGVVRVQNFEPLHTPDLKIRAFPPFGRKRGPGVPFIRLRGIRRGQR